MPRTNRRYKNNKRVSAYKNKKAITKLRRELKPELKYVDTSVIGSAITSVGHVWTLNKIGQGNDFFERDGIKVRLRYLTIKVIMEHTGGGNNHVRVLLVRVKQPGGLQPVAGDILESTVGGTILVSPYHLKEAGHFKVLYDKVHNLNAGGANAFKAFKINKSFNIQSTYLLTTATDASLDMNGLYLMFISNTIGANDPAVTFYARVRFSDI